MTTPTPPPHAASPASLPQLTPTEGCWRKIGVSGDRSCRELETYVHCRNCPVMAEAARVFFDREAPEGYLESWSGILEEPDTTNDSHPLSVLVFRLGKEWLALSTLVLVEVTTPRTCHRVPHRVGGLLEGLLNIRGQLQLCISAHRLLGIDPAAAAEAGQSDAVPPAERFPQADLHRLLVVERTGPSGVDRWVFSTDQVAGVQRVERSSMRAVPSTVSQSGARFCHALFDWQGVVVGILDPSRFFDGLDDQLPCG